MLNGQQYKYEQGSWWFQQHLSKKIPVDGGVSTWPAGLDAMLVSLICQQSIILKTLTMNSSLLTMHFIDPQGADALTLLHQTAIEARSLYQELFPDGSPWPTNPPTPPGGIYLLAYEDSKPIGSGALRPIDERIVEVRRMYVLPSARRGGVARAILARLEQEADTMGCLVMRLETGYKQHAAMKLYESYGFIRIPPFGEYTDDPTNVCYEKVIAPCSD